MASQLNGPKESTDGETPTGCQCRDRIDDHLHSALESAEDEQARYHLREALQLQIAEMQRL